MKNSKDNTLKDSNGPVFVIRPANKKFGFDNLHISLMALTLILLALAIALAAFRPGPIIQNCAYGVVNYTVCATPAHNNSQALDAAESILASFTSLNLPYQILPYYSLVDQANTFYINSSNEWLVTIPYRDPIVNATGMLSMLLYGNNLTLANAYLPTPRPVNYTNDRTIAYGVVGIHGQTPHVTKPPYPVYLFVDPYDAGAFASLFDAINASQKYGSEINMSYYFLFTPQGADRFYNNDGINVTQELGYYLYCASKQQQFPEFVQNLSTEFSGTPPSNLTLYSIALGAGINIAPLDTCIANAGSALEAQVRLFNLYHPQTVPIFVLNDKYLTLPETLDTAINYTINSTQKG